MRTRFAKVRYVEPQGTYIAWLDFSPLGIGDPANYFFKKANVALTDGRECGEVGRGCVRMNFAMPYPLLENASTAWPSRSRRTGCSEQNRGSPQRGEPRNG